MALTEFTEATAPQVQAASGYTGNGGLWRIMQKLIMLGWVKKPWAGRWSITERGKIALAIEVGRRSKQRATARKVTQRGRYKEFMEAEA